MLRAQLDMPSWAWINTQGCCIQGWSPGFGGERMLSADPEFVDPRGPDGVAGTLDDDLGLGPLSPCVDVYPRDRHADLDLDGRPRNVEARACAAGMLDLGALERQTRGEAPTFCPATPSSLGTPASLSSPCLLELGGGPVEVVVSPVPDGFGILLLGDARTEVPFGNGFLCVAGTVRSSAAVPSVAGSLRFPLDPGSGLPGGSSWNLQAIYRDRRAGGAGDERERGSRDHDPPLRDRASRTSIARGEPFIFARSLELIWSASAAPSSGNQYASAQ